MILNCIRRTWLTAEKNFLLERSVKHRNEILWDQVILNKTHGDAVHLNNE